ncbi:Lon protease proteolytic domain protein [Teladorsagia circumcincta]|uniref:Lon protease proteolytic domain protein n=1 Tax=Teladorsagia circumcincta TaxID=45464 RepID=A0A2G9V113_TELCI|nr:Lon protease proteolytic domain protein [Teladorsagia circumcincta]
MQTTWMAPIFMCTYPQAPWVGGIKEKVLGAHRSGIRRVILPFANRNDAEHIDKSIKDEMDIQFSSDIDDLLQKIMEKDSVSNVLSKL